MLGFLELRDAMAYMAYMDRIDMDRIHRDRIDSDITEVVESRLIERSLYGRVPLADVADLRQDVLVKIYSAAASGKLTQVDNLRAYVASVTRHTATDYLRRRAGRRETAVGEINDLDLLATSIRSPAVDNITAIEADEELKETLRYLGRLNTRLRQVFALHVLGYPSPDIAEKLDVTPSTADRYLYKARAELKRRTFEAQDREQAHDEPDSSPEGRQPQRDADARLLRAVRRLGDRQADVLVMSAEGLKPRQIAHLLEIDANAVRVSLHYARKSVMKETGWTAEEVNRRLSDLTGVFDTAKAS